MFPSLFQHFDFVERCFLSIQYPHVIIITFLLLFCSYIKPHIDSVKFCGGVIAGVSLLSSSVMKLMHHEDVSRWIMALLPPRSLYIMRFVRLHNSKLF